MWLLAGSILAGALLGAYQSHQAQKQAQEQAKIAGEANAHSMLIAAGKPQAETKQDPIQFDNDTAKKSAFQQTLVASAKRGGVGGGSSKFGDA